MDNNYRYLGQVHFATLLFGLAGIIGRYVMAPAIIVTLGRVFFSSFFLAMIIFLAKGTFRIAKKSDYLWFGISGLVLALHWTSFMHSIQISSVAIGTVTFSTFPLFVTFMEPLIFKEKLLAKDIVLALLMLLGVLVLVPYNSLDGETIMGILWGMCSSFTYALLSLLNRKLSGTYKSTVICFFEQAVATLVLLPSLVLVNFTFVANEFFLIIFLGVVCTAVAHSLFVAALKKIRAQTAGVISSMESVYGILLALLILGEMPTPREILGGAIILAVTLVASFLSGTQPDCEKIDGDLA